MEISEFIQTGEREGWLHATDNINRMRIDGRDRDCRVYEVRIDRLRYNPQNGRISTFISRYRTEHGELPQDADERNQLIEEMIEEDNPQRLKTTMLDIRAKGQQEVAIILSDGTVIDGNRRFTCLRKLSRQSGEQMFLRCYIFPDTYDEVAIKGLELEVQMGRDEKVAYDAIARLVDINTWVVEGPMGEEEYALHAGMKKGEMTDALAQIDVLNDFLAFIDAPGAYHIAQDLKLQGVVEALAQRLKKCKDDDQREDLKNIAFTNVLMGNLGDQTRVIRDLCDNVLASEAGDGSFADEQLEIAERVVDKLEERPQGEAMSTQFIRDNLMADQDLKAEQKASYEKARTRAATSKIKNGQVRSVHDALGSLDSVDKDVLGKLAPEQLEDMRDTLQEVMSCAARLKVEVDGLLA